MSSPEPRRSNITPLTNQSKRKSFSLYFTKKPILWVVGIYKTIKGLVMSTKTSTEGGEEKSTEECRLAPRNS